MKWGGVQAGNRCSSEAVNDDGHRDRQEKKKKEMGQFSIEAGKKKTKKLETENEENHSD